MKKYIIKQLEKPFKENVPQDVAKMEGERIVEGRMKKRKKKNVMLM